MTLGLRRIFFLACFLFTLSLVALPPQNNTDFHVGDRVNAGFMGSSSLFKDGTIIAVKAGAYRVHFDGYDDRYDEWVPAARVKKISAAAPGATATNRVSAAQPAAGQAAATTEPDCRVGMHLPRAGLLNREATITAIDQRQGLYKVKYDNGDLDEYLPARFIHGCRGVGPAAITTAYFAGKWALFVGPTPHYEDRGSDRYLVVGPGGKAPPLVINADGSYVWTLDSRTQIRGLWREMQPSEFSMSTRAPAIVLMHGEDGKDWGVWRPDSVGRGDTRDEITMKRMDMGTSYMGKRM